MTNGIVSVLHGLIEFKSVLQPTLYGVLNMKKEYRLIDSEPPRPQVENIPYPEVKFESVTKRLVNLSKHEIILCPSCNTPIDFNGYLDWYGPKHFVCAKCSKLVNLALIAQNYRELIFD
jgi:hypothetical protein